MDISPTDLIEELITGSRCAVQDIGPSQLVAPLLEGGMCRVGPAFVPDPTQTGWSGGDAEAAASQPADRS